MSTFNFVDRKALNHAWKQVVLCATGELGRRAVSTSASGAAALRSVDTLLDLLSDPRHDSVTHERLALAALCLAELPVDLQPHQEARLADITTRVVRACDDVARRHLAEVRRCGAPECMDAVREVWSTIRGTELSSCLLPIVHLNGRVDGVPLLDWVERLIIHRAPQQYGRVLAILPFLGPPAATPIVLSALAALVKHPDGEVGIATMEVLWDLYPAIVTDAFLDRLTDLVRDSASLNPMSLTAGVLTQYRDYPLPQRFVGDIAALLYHHRPEVRIGALEVLDAIDTTAATPHVLRRLAALLYDGDARVRSQAADMASTLGRPAFIRSLLPNLLRGVVSDHPSIQDRSATALMHLAAADDAGVNAALQMLSVGADHELAPLAKRALRIVERIPDSIKLRSLTAFREP